VQAVDLEGDVEPLSPHATSDVRLAYTDHLKVKLKKRSESIQFDAEHSTERLRECSESLAAKGKEEATTDVERGHAEREKEETAKRSDAH
jgi:hypothetical protein